VTKAICQFLSWSSKQTRTLRAFPRPVRLHNLTTKHSDVLSFPTNMPPTSQSTQILRHALRCQLRRNGLFRSYSTPVAVIQTTDIPAPHTGTIKILSLNRPKARNAISRQLLSELSQEIDAVAKEPENGPTRALIIASAVDESFCAGADLKERLTFTPQEFVSTPSVTQSL